MVVGALIAGKAGVTDLFPKVRGFYVCNGQEHFNVRARRGADLEEQVRAAMLYCGGNVTVLIEKSR
jgi:hypothetical protein